jgi:hypothetical protein
MKRDKILADLTTAYEDLGNPNYRFARRRLDRQMHRELVADLQGVYSLSESTDLNDDVSRVLSLSRDGAGCLVRLSLVGNYAAISNALGRFLGPEDFDCIETLDKLIAFLLSRGYQILTREDLSRIVEFDTPPRPASFYELLFSSDEALDLSI